MGREVGGRLKREGTYVYVYLWPPDAESRLIGEDLDAGKD